MLRCRQGISLLAQENDALRKELGIQERRCRRKRRDLVKKELIERFGSHEMLWYSMVFAIFVWSYLGHFSIGSEFRWPQTNVPGRAGGAPWFVGIPTGIGKGSHYQKMSTSDVRYVLIRLDPSWSQKTMLVSDGFRMWWKHNCSIDICIDQFIVIRCLLVVLILSVEPPSRKYRRSTGKACCCCCCCCCCCLPPVESVASFSALRQGPLVAALHYLDYQCLGWSKIQESWVVSNRNPYVSWNSSKILSDFAQTKSNFWFLARNNTIVVNHHIIHTFGMELAQVRANSVHSIASWFTLFLSDLARFVGLCRRVAKS